MEHCSCTVTPVANSHLFFVQIEWIPSKSGDAVIRICLLTSLSILSSRSVGLRGPRHWNKTSDCTRAKDQGLVKQQIQICKRNMELMPVVASATREVVRVCEFLFAQYRWNCTSVKLAPKYLPDLTGGE